ncbi:ABC transporter ATP-binding protein [Clostridia bacterium]|nr:ABC transporter ATP-binding protein [Clostridia bacterium]
MIYVNSVTKKYGKTLANDNISLRAEDGELTVLLGPNGAGKSTVIKCICGLLRFTGAVTVFGHDNRSLEAKKLLGYVPEMPAVYAMLTVEEHLRFIAKAYRLTDWEPYAEELMTRFELADKRKKLGQELSKGMQQKVSICCALLPRPKAIIFDEPFVGLDPHAIRELKDLMRGMKAAGAALIISTHLIDSMEETWDTTHIMKNGKIHATRRRADMDGTESLENLYFELTEGSR